LERAEHAAIGIGIDGEQNIAAALDAGSNLIRVLPDHNDDGIANAEKTRISRSRNVSF
jgi:hypothetical protein